MSQKIDEHLASAGVGVALGFFSFFVARVAAFSLTIAALTGAAAITPAGIIGAAALTGTAILAVVCGASALRSRNWFLVRPATAFVSGLATLAVSLCLSFGINPFRQKRVIFTPAQNHAPVENTKGASFTSHKNAFNASARHGKKTLVLTAQDFSRAPALRS